MTFFSIRVTSAVRLTASPCAEDPIHQEERRSGHVPRLASHHYLPTSALLLLTFEGIQELEVTFKIMPISYVRNFLFVFWLFETLRLARKRNAVLAATRDHWLRIFKTCRIRRGRRQIERTMSNWHVG